VVLEFVDVGTFPVEPTRHHRYIETIHLKMLRKHPTPDVAMNVDWFPVVGFIPRLKPMGFRLATAVTTLLNRPTPSVPDMFDEIMEKFEGSPSQQAVIRLLLERGFSVNDDGRVVSGGIEIPNTGIAREIGVDRRVVDSTTDAILADDDLRRIFQNISQVPSLMDLAPVLDLTVLTVEVTDADEEGILATVAGTLADADISIRQTISEDPEFAEDPKLYLITDESLPGDVINEINGYDFVRKIELQ